MAFAFRRKPIAVSAYVSVFYPSFRGPAAVRGGMVDLFVRTSASHLGRALTHAATSRGNLHPPLLYLGYGGSRRRQAWRWPCCYVVTLTRRAPGCVALGLARLVRVDAGDYPRLWRADRQLGWAAVVLDPVQNASLLPLLSASALLHSLCLTPARIFATCRCCWRLSR
ncbi:hypothetical protein ACNKHK_26620 [Shigella flexneri]